MIQIGTARFCLLLLSFLMWGALGFEIQDNTSHKSHPNFLCFQNEQPLSRTDPKHYPIATTSAQAQANFDQGMAFFYAFNFGEAIRAFENASKLDPRAAMPYWGIALANSPSYNNGIYNSLAREKAAYDTIQKAKQLAARGKQKGEAFDLSGAFRFIEPQAQHSCFNLRFFLLLR